MLLLHPAAGRTAAVCRRETRRRILLLLCACEDAAKSVPFWLLTSLQLFSPPPLLRWWVEFLFVVITWSFVLGCLSARCCCSLPSHLFSSSLCSSAHTDDDEDAKLESEPRSTVYTRHGQTAARGPYAAR